MYMEIVGDLHAKNVSCTQISISCKPFSILCVLCSICVNHLAFWAKLMQYFEQSMLSVSSKVCENCVIQFHLNCSHLLGVLEWCCNFNAGMVCSWQNTYVYTHENKSRKQYTYHLIKLVFFFKQQNKSVLNGEWVNIESISMMFPCQ